MRKNYFLMGISCLIAMVLSGQQAPNKLGIETGVSGIKLVGGPVDGCVIDYMASLALKYSFTEKVTGELIYGLGWVRPRDPDNYFKVGSEGYRTYLYPFNINLRLNMNPENMVNPYIGAGLGRLQWNLRDVSSEDNWSPLPESGKTVWGAQNHWTLSGLFGAEHFLSEKVALDYSLRYIRILNQKKDNIGRDDANTGLLEVRLGLGYYFTGFKDTDKDGIEDKLDLAPNDPEDFDGFEDWDGRPEPDNDGDGIPDINDQAPDLPEDIDGFRDEDGLPDLDNDQDGIPDSRDGAPDEAEDLDGFMDKDGIPDWDNDNDAIPDSLDQCPDEAETLNDFEDEDGCPDEAPHVITQLEMGQAVVLPEITFDTGKSTLTTSSKTVLHELVQTLEDNTEIRLEIRGYTDNIGNDAYNLKLSRDRAESVKRFLTASGIAVNRLESVGLGEQNPVASNATTEGRAQNRRIEFKRLDE